MHFCEIVSCQLLRNEYFVKPYLASTSLSIEMTHLCWQAIGFDMDYTLAQYKADTFEALAHKATVEKLISQFHYPDDLRNFSFK